MHSVHRYFPLTDFPNGSPNTNTPLNGLNCAHLSLSRRKLRVLLRRHLALQTFALWVIEPNDTRFVEHGRLLAAARIANSFIKGKPSTAERKFLELEFSRKAVASGLLSPPVIGPFSEEIDHRKPDLELAASVVETLLRAPLSRLRKNDQA
jgi:hypothetical protein